MPSDETTRSSAEPGSDATMSSTSDQSASPVRRTRRRAASRPAGPPQPTTGTPPSDPATTGGTTHSSGTTQSTGTTQSSGTTNGSQSGSGTATGTASDQPVAKKTSRRGGKKAAAAPEEADVQTVPIQVDSGAGPSPTAEEPALTPAKRTSTRKRPAKASAASPLAETATDGAPGVGEQSRDQRAPDVFAPVFQAPDPSAAQSSSSPSQPAGGLGTEATAGNEQLSMFEGEHGSESEGGDGDETGGSSAPTRRRRSRGGRNRRKPSDASGQDPTDDVTSVTDADGSSPRADDTPDINAEKPAAAKKTSKTSSKKSSKKPAEQAATEDDVAEGLSMAGSEPKDSEEGGSSSSRRRRRRRRSGDGPSDSSGDAPETVVKVREPRSSSDSITSVEGSTRIEAKKQRRREGREAGRRRAPILSESEFLARRESVDRVMVIRQRDDVTQIAVLEDNVLVEHYVALETQSSLIGNVYLGRVQNVLPSMEAAFIDIGKGRNAVLYAGEVNWDLIGDRNQPRRIENALKSGQQILVQVSKDPVGHKGARLTSQISLPGRYLVYVPGGGSSGISRKLPDTERNRLKNLLKEILPDESGVIIRTAAEGATEEELTRDVRRLTSRWEEIEKLVKGGRAPTLLYAEPDITLKVVRDLFTEDFARLVVSGDQAWDTVNDYVSYVAPDLTERLERYDGNGDVFDIHRVDEQIAKALERKVWLPSGGSLVIDRTEAMTVVDVNTGKFTGSGGNLEQTVTKNNLEAAEEIVRQLRLRDIGGIIVIDFIDMVLENNRDLVLRRLVECLGRDRTRHQVAEVTSLGLVQMTRKRIGTGLVESFSVPCEVCHGRGVIIEAEPVKGRSDEPDSSGRASTKRSSGRQRSAGKREPEPEGIDPSTAERHSAAAAATAAIAAALHLDTRHDSAHHDEDLHEHHDLEPNGVQRPDSEQLDSEDAEPLIVVGEPQAVELSEAAATEEAAPAAPAKTTRTRKASTAKKTTAKKATAKKATKAAAKTTSRKQAAAAGDDVSGAAVPEPEPVGVSS